MATTAPKRPAPRARKAAAQPADGGFRPSAGGGGGGGNAPDLTWLGRPAPDPDWAPLSAAPASEVLARLLARLKLDERFRQNDLRAAWPELVGDFNARHCHPDSLRGGVLIVRVTNAPLKHHLEMLKDGLLQRVQERLGKAAVRELRFQV